MILSRCTRPQNEAVIARLLTTAKCVFSWNQASATLLGRKSISIPEETKLILQETLVPDERNPCEPIIILHNTCLGHREQSVKIDLTVVNVIKFITLYKRNIDMANHLSKLRISGSTLEAMMNLVRLFTFWSISWKRGFEILHLGGCLPRNQHLLENSSELIILRTPALTQSTWPSILVEYTIQAQSSETVIQVPPDPAFHFP